jgi:hypothetical protein
LLGAIGLGGLPQLDRLDGRRFLGTEQQAHGRDRHRPGEEGGDDQAGHTGPHRAALGATSPGESVLMIVTASLFHACCDPTLGR